MNFTIEQLMRAYFYFALYSFGGWVVQGCWVGFKKHRFVNTGFYRGPWVPIFGFGCLLIIYVIDPLSMNPFMVFFNAFWMTSVLEYITSWYLQKVYHRLWWDYSDKPFNIHGRVCLLNSTMYGLAGLAITFGAQPILDRMVSRIPFPVLCLIMAVFTVFFATDVFTTLLEMQTHKKALESLHTHIQSALSAGLEDQKALIEKAKTNLETLESHKRHLRGMVHQRLEDSYQKSVEAVKSLLHSEN